MDQPLVISVILNTNRREDTLECLTSLAQSSYPNQRTIVLDNHSIDGSVQTIRAAFPAAQIIELTENLGYAGNNNVGIQAALLQGADWVFVLNEDTILDPDCISLLVKVGASDSFLSYQRETTLFGLDSRVRGNDGCAVTIIT